jgi:3-phosphoshikimate 1-carboxyvinyltransferase
MKIIHDKLMVVSSNTSINDTIDIQGDKSISHRAIIFSAIAQGTSTIVGLLESDDVNCTKEAFIKHGVVFQKDIHGFTIHSPGFHNFTCNTDEILYMGNSGTSARLLMGLFASLKSKITLIGDNSLNGRPMQRVVEPLSLMGAKIELTNNNFLPSIITGGNLKGITYTLNTPSAQVKSAILLASLMAEGTTEIIEPVATRNHTECMLNNLKVNIRSEAIKEGTKITINNNRSIIPTFNYNIPKDFSSSAFFIALALIKPNTILHIPSVNLNPTRTGFLKVVLAMGADITILNEKVVQGEQIGDLVVKTSSMTGINVSGDLSPSMIDEYPILAVVASFASGTTTFNNIQELKYKESNRLQSIIYNLNLMQVKVVEKNDSLEIYGNNNIKEGGVEINSNQDHRIAMSFLIMGIMCKNTVTVSGCSSIQTSFPSFVDICCQLGLNISPLN